MATITGLEVYTIEENKYGLALAYNITEEAWRGFVDHA